MISSDTLLRVFAVLIGIRAIDNILKSQSLTRGLVFFGVKLTGVANEVVGPLFGIYMFIYAFGIWRMRRFALPMGVAYAVFAVSNMMLFPIRSSIPHTTGFLLGYLLFVAIGTGVTGGAAWMLYRRRAELR